MIRNLKKLWEKTGDVEKIRGRAGRPKSFDEYLEQAIVQIFLENVDITMEEALDWVEEEFKQRVCRMTLSRLLKRNGVSHKRLKFVAAQRNPTLRADYLMRVEDFYDDQLVFLDEPAANEFTKDRKFGWSLVGCPAAKERDFRRSERWSILPAYTTDGYMAWKIFQGSYTKEIFNHFVYTEVLPRMNAYSEDRPPRSVLVMDNAKIHCSDELQKMCNEAGVLLVYLPPYSPDYNPIEQPFNQIKQWMRKNRDTQTISTASTIVIITTAVTVPQVSFMTATPPPAPFTNGPPGASVPPAALSTSVGLVPAAPVTPPMTSITVATSGAPFFSWATSATGTLPPGVQPQTAGPSIATFTGAAG